MGCDMTVALGPATVNGSTLLALNRHAPVRQAGRLVLQPGRPHVLDEKVKTQYLELSPCKQTFTALGFQPNLCWGFQHGINEHQVAAGCSDWQSLLSSTCPGLTGNDLVRLVLERSCNARQGVDLLTDLIRRHGQGQIFGLPGSEERDHIYLIADPQEAFVVEAAGKYWSWQEIGQVRAVSDVPIIRQDWNRLSPGLSDLAFTQKYWPEDGSKLDFAGCLNLQPTGEESALRRWGRATFLLESQNGHIDLAFLRRILGDHYEGTRFEIDPLLQTELDPAPLCRHEIRSGGPATQVSFLAELKKSAPGMVVWYAFGPPCLGVFFPILLMQKASLEGFSIFLDQYSQRLSELSGQLVRNLDREADRWHLAREKLGWLQVRFEEDTAEFLHEVQELPGEDISRQVQLFLERNAEQFEDIIGEMVPQDFAAPEVLALS